MKGYRISCVVASGVVIAAASGSAHAAGAKALYTNIASSPTSLIPGGAGLRFSLGTASQFDRPYVSGNGRYFIFTALAEIPTTTDDEFIIVGELGSGSILSANTVAREGVTAVEPGRLIESASIGRNAAINDSGDYVFQANLSGVTTDDEVIVRGSNFMSPALGVAVREGQTTGALPGTISLGATIDSPGIANNGKISFRSTLTGAPTGQTTAAFLDDGSTLAAQTGVTIPGGLVGGPSTWQAINSDDFYVASNGSDWLATGDTNAATTIDGLVARTGHAVLQEGQMLPGYGGAATIAAFGEQVMAPSGNYMVRGALSDTTDYVAYNGSAVAITNDTVPGGLPGETFSQAIFTGTFFAIAANGVGDYVYGGTTSNPDPEFDAVLIYNDSFVVARQGDPVDIDGNGLFDDNAFIDVFNNDDMFLTDDGYLYFFADLRDSASTTIGQAFLTIQVPAPAALPLVGLVGVFASRRRR